MEGSLSVVDFYRSLILIDITEKSHETFQFNVSDIIQMENDFQFENHEPQNDFSIRIYQFIFVITEISWRTSNDQQRQRPRQQIGMRRRTSGGLKDVNDFNGLIIKMILRCCRCTFYHRLFFPFHFITLSVSLEYFVWFRVINQELAASLLRDWDYFYNWPDVFVTKSFV